MKFIPLYNFQTIIGVAIAMFYSRLPHISLIALFYSIGSGMMFVALINCICLNICDDTLVESMTHYALIGGLYLPFVTDAVINLVGAKRRATGAAIIEFGGTIAQAIGAYLFVVAGFNHIIVLLIIVVLYVFATLFQRMAEPYYKF